METKEYQDITLICKESGEEFIWTAGEQEFYAERGFQQPKYSPAVRAKRKAEREANRGNRYNDSNSRFAYKTDNN